ncbi:hypothetical protein MPTK1_1g07560 [Marchantia polymorpha subsp. ruderalis]|uniref:Uncharacterized protein n=2 Tax=Marchantia polymorpha TaxID=3197 RepID=A0AAF6AML4_MARPO|nr:hypothetical protein MARPO_0036s0003 [Marchantia polymorpha]BBM97684.1 hypothetical protein Mp_1g07560 [Marchantia polymorpha subsp. ruderalis]|eukprot:PTQ40990.1 hypothetical protein MARPO_0036s0003 [Marchantia polymorpha]
MASSSKSPSNTDGKNELCQLLQWTADNYSKNAKLGFQAPIIQELERQTCIRISHIADDGLAILGRVLQQHACPNLKSVVIIECRLEKMGIVEFCRALAVGNLSGLEALSVQDNRMGDMELIAIAGALGSGKCFTLKRLYLGSDRDIFQTEGAQSMAEVLESGHLPLLEDLSVRGVEEEDGMLAIFRALEARKVAGLKSLDFQGCAIRLGAVSVLARALQFSPHFCGLIKLDLSGCRTMGDDEVIALSQALRSRNMVHLWCLGLANLTMGERGFLEIASLLKAGHLPGLQYLYATDCDNTETSARALIEAYCENTSLVVDMTVDWPSWTFHNDAHDLMVRNEALLEQQHTIACGKDLHRARDRDRSVDTSLVEFDEHRSRPSSSVLFLIKKFRVSRWKISQMLSSIKKCLGRKRSKILFRIASLSSRTRNRKT